MEHYNNYGKIIKYWLPVLLWCGVIYYLSSVPDLKSDFPDKWDFVFRKIAHMGEYAVLAYLAFRAFGQDLSLKKSLAYSVIFSVTYSLTDEYHQTFITGRSGNLEDVFIDSLGVFFTFFLIDKKLIDVSIKKGIGRAKN